MRINVAALLIVWGILAPCALAQTLSISPLTAAMQNPDLLLAEDDAKLAAARNAVAGQLLNEPSARELAGFHARLKLLAQHKDTRLGRLFFAALSATPDLAGLPAEARQAGVGVFFPLALGSGIQVRAAWTRAGDAFRVSAFSVAITGNAGALLSAAAPYFGTGTPNLADLDSPELDYLLGRDPADLLKPEPGRAVFDFDGALTKRFGVQPGEPAALLKSLREGLGDGAKPEEKLALLARHLSADENKKLGGAAKDPKFWGKIAGQVDALGKLVIAGHAPKFEGASVTVHQDTPQGRAEWTLRRIDGGELALSGAGIGATNEEGK